MIEGFDLPLEHSKLCGRNVEYLYGGHIYL